MDKKSARVAGIARLEKLSKNTRLKQKKEKIIRSLLFNSKSWQEAKTIAMIRSTVIEFDTDPLLAAGFAEGKRICVPIAGADKKMTFHEVTAATDYQLSSFGILEPVGAPIIEKAAIDLILVPGVVFDPQGHRIGFGAGYYDIYLADYQGSTCSLVFSEQLSEDWQPQEFDLPVQRIFTDNYKEGTVSLDGTAE